MCFMNTPLIYLYILEGKSIPIFTFIMVTFITSNFYFFSYKEKNSKNYSTHNVAENMGRKSHSGTM